MRRGLIQDYANQVCQIFTGWRMHVSPGDLPLLLTVGKGQLDLDLIAATATIDARPVEFTFVEELHDWLKERAGLDGIGWEAAERAEMNVAFECHEGRGRRRDTWVRQLDFTCVATVEAADHVGRCTRQSSETGVMTADGPWVVH